MSAKTKKTEAKKVAAKKPIAKQAAKNTGARWPKRKISRPNRRHDP